MIRWLAALLVAAVPTWAEPLRIGTDGDYHPFSFRDASGTLTGYDIAVGNAICARGGFECEWTVMAFVDLNAAIAAGKIDIAIAAMADTPERRQIVDFSRSYRLDDGGPSTGAFAAMIPGLSAEGQLAAAQEGTIHAEYLADIGHPHRLYRDITAMLDALDRGEVQVIFDSWGHLEQLIENGFTALRIIETADVPGYPTAIAISRARPDLKTRIDAILNAMIKTGEIATLESIWFPDGLSL